ncbi:MAG: ABC transporter permease [Defluviitaleaceae bacterium]|nr:ABC transporter permease [Defluviitaleaceae bacterium]
MRLKYNLLQYLRDREVLFYTLVIPLVMGTIFFQIMNFVDEETGVIPVAIVEQGALTSQNQAFLELANNLEQQERLEITFINYESAIGMLQADQVFGVIILGETMELMLTSAGTEQSILESIVNEFTIQYAATANIAELRPQYLEQALAAINSYVSVSTPARNIPISQVANFFYVFLAMGAFTSSIRGLKMGFELQADISNTAARISIAPTKKLVLIVENLISAVVAQTLGSTITLLFYVFVLGINFGTQWGLILLTCVVGSFASVSFGILFSIVVPGNEDKKGGYLALVIYTFMFTSGVFALEIRTLVRDAFPLFDRINIISIISDTFLTLVLHEGLGRFVQQLSILMGIAIVCSVAGAIALRRKSYANL